MSKKFHISSGGTPAECRAKIKCRLGGESGQENHFDSLEEAQAFSEKKLTEEHGAIVTKKKVSQTELNSIAKDSSDPKELLKAAQHGGERVLKNIALNSNATPEVLAMVKERSTATDTRILANNHRNRDIDYTDPMDVNSYMSGDYWEAAKRKERLLKAIESDNLSEAEVNGVYEANRYDKAVIKSILSSDNPNLSKEFKVQLFREAPDSSDPVLVQKLDAELPEYLKLAGPQFKNSVASYSTNKEALSMLAKEYSEAEYKNETDVSYKAVALYKNQALSDQDRELLKKEFPIVESYSKVAGVPHQSVITDHVKNASRGGAEAYTFDKEFVKSKGWTAKEVDSYVRLELGNHLFGASYDDVSGVYTGYTD